MATKTTTKTERSPLATLLSERVSGVKAERVDAILEELKELVRERVLEGGETISLPGLGVFKLRTIPAHEGRDFSSTDKEAKRHYGATRAVIFRPSTSLRRAEEEA